MMTSPNHTHRQFHFDLGVTLVKIYYIKSIFYIKKLHLQMYKLTIAELNRKKLK